ncbi:MAG: HU family DNA-binding protein [Pseudomonadota bacterium]|nr:HU family DNA-binding protein [Pseudomonadota bacterium]
MPTKKATPAKTNAATKAKPKAKATPRAASRKAATTAPKAPATAARAKASPVKRAAPPASPRKVTALSSKLSKTQILEEIAANTELSKKDVGAVLDELGVVIERHIKKRAVGEFTLPGLLKIKSVKKPARRARKNVPNPFKPGELMDVAAKPASVSVKITPLKKLKEMAN